MPLCCLWRVVLLSSLEGVIQWSRYKIDEPVWDLITGIKA